MNPIFNQIELRGVDSNTFNLSHDKKMTLDMGYLVPTMLIDTIPGDSMHFSTSQMIRFAPLIAPVMHKINVYTHFFFVPNRLVWENWSDFITGGEKGDDNSVFPYLSLGKTELTDSSLPDYLGLPSAKSTDSKTVQVSAIPFAAYHLIYNEYFRDQNLITDLDVLDTNLADGSNDAKKAAFCTLKKRAWQHDYFTSALPWTQKGVEATIPLGTRANIVYEPIIDGLVGSQKFRDAGTNNFNLVTGNIMAKLATTTTIPSVAGTKDVSLDISETHQVDLTEAAAASINDLRRAFRLQEWLEKNARGGSRYTESMLVHFGVKSSDARLQRPEYLGGVSTPVVFSEIQQTSGSPVDPGTGYTPTPQGNLAGHGINVGGSNTLHHYSEEHGYIIGIMSIMPQTAYFQGIPKHFSKFDKFDYFWPSFANLGEQPITNQELYLNLADTALNGATFGYTPRYAEYKFQNNTIHGAFRSSLDYWHMARKLAALPNLNKTFIEADPDKRIFAVEDPAVNSLYAHVYNQVSAKRKMPVFGTPTI